jgi:hypothetical protein
MSKPKTQTNKLYKAEREWRETDPEASRKVGIREARQIATQVIYNPAHDTVPGIDELRENFKARGVQYHHPITGLITGKRLPKNFHAGTSPDSNELFLRRGKVNVGTVTHEASHLVERLGRQFSGINPVTTAHDPVFARTHFESVRGVVGHESALGLAESYKLNGIQMPLPYRGRQ